jgi:uncharacterized protein
MEKFSSFAEAIKANNILAVKEMLDENPTLIHSVTPEGFSVVMLAAYNHHVKLLEILVMRKRRLDIHEASAAGVLREVERIILKDKTKIIEDSADGYSPMHLASWFGHTEVVKLLAQKGGHISGVSTHPSKVTPLISAVAGKHTEVAEYLIKAQADINAKQKGGITALHSAANNGHAAMIKLLVDNGADKTIKTDDGKTAADIAKEKGFTQIVDFLEGRLKV